MTDKFLVFIETEYKAPRLLKRQFIDTTYMAPELLRHVLQNRTLWQEEEENQSRRDSGYVTDIKEDVTLPKVTFQIDRPECTTVNNGVCSECKLSRQIEEAYKSEKANCSQQ